jgi:hypothetical protein
MFKTTNQDTLQKMTNSQLVNVDHIVPKRHSRISFYPPRLTDCDLWDSEAAHCVVKMELVL